MRADNLSETAAPSPPAGLVTVGRFDQGPGYRINRPGGSDNWLFTWTTDGAGLLRQGATEVVAGPGDLVVLGPGVPHRYAVLPGAEHWAFCWAHCPSRTSWADWLRPYGIGDRLYAVTHTHGGVRDRVTTAFGRMIADARWTGEGAPPALEGSPAVGEVAVAHGTAARELALCSLEEVVLLATARVEGSGRSEVDSRILRAEGLIAADPGAAHTVRSLAARVSLSPSRFAHLFTEQLGLSPMRALLDARLVHAARLLEATDLPVERVAAASGFRSPFHFSRVFRQRYGVPPGGYRDGVRGG
ncbi:helix-turn-helix domain-containing protein [Streptomyces sp. NPDC046862]|uniref:helix-turn-helix domain-containing protein n=1 Tax=Streptomyces sp. NPDC046862 TaxID=3154603 RepID=UPI00345554C0